MATVKFKNHIIERPSNVSMDLVKKACLALGQDYSFTVNDVIQFISQAKLTETEIPDKVTKLLMFEVHEA